MTGGRLKHDALTWVTSKANGIDAAAISARGSPCNAGRNSRLVDATDKE
jgi:hypothetical protein